MQGEGLKVKSDSLTIYHFCHISNVPEVESSHGLSLRRILLFLGTEGRQQLPAAMHSVGQGVSVPNASTSPITLTCATQNDVAWWVSPFCDCSAWLGSQPSSNLYPKATQTFWAPIGQESGFISECQHLLWRLLRTAHHGSQVPVCSLFVDKIRIIAVREAAGYYNC